MFEKQTCDRLDNFLPCCGPCHGKPWLADSARTNRHPDKSTMTRQLTQQKPTTSYTKATQKTNSRTMTTTPQSLPVLPKTYTKKGTIPLKSNKQPYDNYMKPTQNRTNNQKATHETANQKASQHSHNLHICQTRQRLVCSL
jgi:hypothetical protein